ncbi:hypothetical protein D1816_11480 [Aquimarina sp. AD10]|uniref:hypothetical protein n=1 Tax=Aquimarina sp. AD10 TaxID=1714849 RepID=UPI000E4EDBA2|nr:hypothetical protein [Aquimarina sp. AD10]AXT60942.1 hypothetical protein D1816_11480 [Aquimarina sp. AD10]RKM95584.1 hypothetical protein D7033_16955 [Aquimarina sp. AD10]
MNTHADKTQEKKSQSVSIAGSQMQSGGESTFQFMDNRPEAIAQRKLHEMANNSPRVSQFRAFQKMANVNSLSEARKIQQGNIDASVTTQQKKNGKERATTLSEVVQRVTVGRIHSDIHQVFGAVNTLAALNAILTAHGIVNFTEAEIFKRLRPGGHVGTGNEMFTRVDGVILDQYVQIRIGNLNAGALTAVVNAAIASMGQTFYDNRTGGPLMAGFSPAGLAENGNLVPRQNLLGMLRTQLSADIAAMAVQNITVAGGNGYSVTAAALNNFLYTEGATLTQIVTALTQATVAVNGAWNRVRTLGQNPNYRAELKIGGIPGRRVFAPTGSMVLSVVGNSLH